MSDFIDLEDQLPGLSARIEAAGGIPIRFHPILWADLVAYFVQKEKYIGLVGVFEADDYPDTPEGDAVYLRSETDDKDYDKLSISSGVEKLLNQVLGEKRVWLPLKSQPTHVTARKSNGSWYVE